MEGEGEEGGCFSRYCPQIIPPRGGKRKLAQILVYLGRADASYEARENPGAFRVGVVGDELEASGEEPVAGENGVRRSESRVQGRDPSPYVGSVENVIVDEARCVDEFYRRGDVGYPAAVCGCSAGFAEARAYDDEGRPEHLSAGEDDFSRFGRKRV